MAVKDPNIPKPPERATTQQLQEYTKQDSKQMQSFVKDLAKQVNWPVVTAAPTETPARVPMVKLMDDGAGGENLYIYYAGGWKKFSSGGSFASGTKMWFYNSAAPTGWTIQTGLGDKVLAVHGTAAYASSTAGGQQKGTWTISGLTNSSLNLTYNQVSSHYHYDGMYHYKYGTGAYPYGYSSTSTGYNYQNWNYTSSANRVLSKGQSKGSTTTHTHTISSGGAWRPYANVGIIAAKD